MDKNTPAFPCTDEGKRVEGMTLHQYFAGQIICGFCADSTLASSLEQMVEYTFRLSDAMLAEYEKREK